jgi:hypothetical protein
LADAQIAQLRLLEIGIDPDLAERADRHQVLPDLNIIARIDISARDDAVDLRDDVAIAKVQFGHSQITLGGREFGFGLLDGRRLRRQLSERAVDVAFGIELFELFEHLRRSLADRMDDPQLSRGLKEICLRLQDRREGLIEIGRDLAEIPALGLRRQP